MSYILYFFKYQIFFCHIILPLSSFNDLFAFNRETCMYAARYMFSVLLRSLAKGAWALWNGSAISPLLSSIPATNPVLVICFSLRPSPHFLSWFALCLFLSFRSVLSRISIHFIYFLLFISLFKFVMYTHKKLNLIWMKWYSFLYIKETCDWSISLCAYYFLMLII